MFVFKKNKAEINKKSINSNSIVEFIRNENSMLKTDNPTDLCNAYSQNVIVNRAINLIATSVASVPWHLQHKNSGKIFNDHPLLTILNNPSPLVGGAELFQNIISFKLLFGNAFLYVAKDSRNTPIELYSLRTDKIKLNFSKNGDLLSYIYKQNDRKITFPIDRITGKSDILHIKNFNPTNSHYGLSQLSSCVYAVEQHNEACKWNLSLLKNSARPSGALVFNNNDSTNFMTDEQFEFLKSEISESYSAAKNAGRPILLQGGLEWKELSMSPKDMDYLAAKNSNSRDIAICFGVPSQLLGLPGDATYNNMQEARLALWEETIIPLLDRLLDSLNSWLVPLFDNNLKLSYNLDAINALAARREKLWQRIENANFLTINEKRYLTGMAPIKDGNQL